jgi:flagellar motor switch protein FliG
MSSEKLIVLTSYGHNKMIDRIAVSLFDKGDDRHHSSSNADTYCDTLNAVTLRDETWVFSKVVTENTQYALDVFTPRNFTRLITELDDKAIQKMLKEVWLRDLAGALKGTDSAVQEKIFKNMSARAQEMLKEDMECMGRMRLVDVLAQQGKIMKIIRRLAESGEIIISSEEGGTL